MRPKSLMSRTAPRYLANAPAGIDKTNKQGFAMTFIHLGRQGYQITLWSQSWAGRKKWLEKIEGRQQELREKSLVFETIPLSAGYFVGTNRVTCAAPFGKLFRTMPTTFSYELNFQRTQITETEWFTEPTTGFICQIYETRTKFQSKSYRFRTSLSSTSSKSKAS